MLLYALLDRYIDLQVQLCSDTLIEYRGTIHWLNRWLERPATIDDLNDSTITQFLKAVSATRSAATVSKHRRHALMLWSFAWREELVEQMPRKVPKIRVPRRQPKAWTPDEVTQILAACGRARSIPGWKPERWKALALSIYDAGERIDPLLRIPKSAFDRHRKLLMVSAEFRKRGAEDQLYCLHDDTVEAIQASIEPDQDRLFPWPLGVRSIWPAWKRILTDAGLPAGRRDMFHKLRRTNYTQAFIHCGREVARRNAGHSRDLTHLYLDESQLPARSICDAISRPARS